MNLVNIMASTTQQTNNSLNWVEQLFFKLQQKPSNLFRSRKQLQTETEYLPMLAHSFISFYTWGNNLPGSQRFLLSCWRLTSHWHPMHIKYGYQQPFFHRQGSLSYNALSICTANTNNILRKFFVTWKTAKLFQDISRGFLESLTFYVLLFLQFHGTLDNLVKWKLSKNHDDHRDHIQDLTKLKTYTAYVCNLSDDVIIKKLTFHVNLHFIDLALLRSQWQGRQCTKFHFIPIRRYMQQSCFNFFSRSSLCDSSCATACNAQNHPNLHIKTNYAAPVIQQQNSM